MLTRLAVTDFQSLADVDLELGPLTVLVGPSNSGKSAVRRALEAVVTNAAPAGRLRTGAKTMRVEVSTDAGETVIWEKGSGTNAYTVDAGGGPAVRQDKPGPTITPEADAVLRIGANTSFADQFDRPFLLAETPSQAARILGDLTNANVLFDAAKVARTTSRRQATIGEDRQRQADALTAKLGEFADLPGENRALETAAAALAEARRTASAAADLRSAHATATEAAVTFARSEALASAPPLAVDVDHAESLLVMATTDVVAWAGVLARAQEAHERLTTPLPPAPPDVAAVEHAAARAHVLSVRHDEAAEAAATMARIDAEVETITAALALAEAELAEVDTCPLCGTAGVHLERS